MAMASVISKSSGRYSSVLATNVEFQKGQVSRCKRGEALSGGKNFRGCTIWFTGKKFLKLIFSILCFIYFFE